MITYYFLGNYTSKSLNSVSAARTKECAELVENYDGEIILMHALIGQYDLALISMVLDRFGQKLVKKDFIKDMKIVLK